MRVTTVIDAAMLDDSVAVTVALVSTAGAKARHTSAVPICVLVRRTSAQVSPPPAILETVVLVPEVGPSVEMKASKSSLAAAVVKAGLAMVAALVLRSVETVLSMANSAVDVKFTAVILAPATVTAWLAGVKMNPVLLGVTV